MPSSGYFFLLQMLLLYYVVSRKSLHTPTRILQLSELFWHVKTNYGENVTQFTHFHAH